MNMMESLSRFFLRFRYPVSLPEDVANALGVQISNFVTFTEFFNYLTCPLCQPTRLQKFMPRDLAERAFAHAQCKEHFKNDSLFSFYFSEGWVEFVLQFDGNSKLRRIYLQHKNIDQDLGIEIRLNKAVEL